MKDSDLFYVVKNIEEQYSIWPNYKCIPKGWEIVCGPVSKEESLVYIEKNWLDMRPLSLQKELKKQQEKK